MLVQMKSVEECIETLSRSERGRAALSDTLGMLDNGGIGLDQYAQHALLELLVHAFIKPGSTRDAMREAAAVAT